MNHYEAETIIGKYLTNQASQEEITALTLWLEKSKNKTHFTEFVQINYALDFNEASFDLEKTKNFLLKKIKQDKNQFSRQKTLSILKYAAMIIFFIGIGYLAKSIDSNANDTILVPDESAVTLELENGMIEILNPKSSKKLQNGQGKIIGQQTNKVITYNASVDIETLVYNTLKVPYGKQFDLVLSDGTKVFLNAGTSIKFPVKFLPGKKREVFLNGEAYFDVEKDKAHPFIVSSQELNIEVIGTKFVVSAYPEDNNTGVVLLEGSVGLSIEGRPIQEPVLLIPSQRGSLNKNSKQIYTETVNTSIYTGWMDGILVFRNMSFDNITKKLERHYNVKIVNNSDPLGKEVFNASFHKEPIETILSYFKDSYNMNYTIEENVIYIN